jgi:hypothetical protein
MIKLSSRSGYRIHFAAEDNRAARDINQFEIIRHPLIAKDDCVFELGRGESKLVNTNMDLNFLRIASHKEAQEAQKY